MSWSMAEQDRIQQIQKQRGCTRGNAIRVLRREQQTGKVEPLPGERPAESEAKPEIDREATRKAHHPAMRHDKPKAKKTAGKKLTYAELAKQREAEGACVKCGRYKAVKGGRMCAVCPAMAKTWKKCREEKREWSRKNFMRTQAFEEALKLSPEVKR